VRAIEVVPEVEFPPLPERPRSSVRPRRRLALAAGALILVGGITLPPAPPQPATNRRLSSLSVVAGAGALWVTDGSTRLLRIDPDSGRILTALDVHEPLDDVAVGARAVWATSGQASSVFQIDLRAPRGEDPDSHRESPRHRGAVPGGRHGGRRVRLGTEWKHPDG